MKEEIKDNLEEDAKNDQQISGFGVNQYCKVVIKDEVIIKDEPIEEAVNEDLNHSQHFVKVSEVEEDQSSNANSKSEVEADVDPLKFDEYHSTDELPFESVSRLENCQYKFLICWTPSHAGVVGNEEVDRNLTSPMHFDRDASFHLTAPICPYRNFSLGGCKAGLVISKGKKLRNVEPNISSQQRNRRQQPYAQPLHV
ncbi:hypothetical protein Anas_12385 [Armadillidium nasatum]|uniref:RNase H type-1 domain-containing protein n=1 Tax=Armadillidium nasatum TaxID=96803 RepID=A0A5N5T808_9CRUS|nr:hypothetical protein Anas_12385 [Armadillidium nasatum]